MIDGWMKNKLDEDMFIDVCGYIGLGMEWFNLFGAAIGERL